MLEISGHYLFLGGISYWPISCLGRAHLPQHQLGPRHGSKPGGEQTSLVYCILVNSLLYRYHEARIKYLVPSVHACCHISSPLTRLKAKQPPQPALMGDIFAGIWNQMRTRNRNTRQPSRRKRSILNSTRYFCSVLGSCGSASGEENFRYATPPDRQLAVLPVKPALPLRDFEFLVSAVLNLRSSSLFSFALCLPQKNVCSFQCYLHYMNK